MVLYLDRLGYSFGIELLFMLDFRSRIEASTWLRFWDGIVRTTFSASSTVLVQDLSFIGPLITDFG